MSTTLCFDFGNTRLKCAYFSGKELQKVIVLDNDDTKTIQECIDTFHPERSILSSVIHHNPSVEKILQETTRFHKLDHNSKVPITTPVGKPDTIGADRLALSVAAVDLFPGKIILSLDWDQPLLIILSISTKNLWVAEFHRAWICVLNP